MTKLNDKGYIMTKSVQMKIMPMTIDKFQEVNEFNTMGKLFRYYSEYLTYNRDKHHYGPMSEDDWYKYQTQNYLENCAE